jgi:UDP-3-O-[3-hydroxymyristoyl] N-acetylglucosamine deacetylase / 3-hydroxyacyl-[acyl-carrier-protein] dehydratase
VIVDRDIDRAEMNTLAGKLGLDPNAHLNENGFFNDVTLRWRNEPARHKLLDLIGDLTLVGVPLKAQILAARPGHASNVEFARMIRKLYLDKQLVKKYQPARTEGVVFDITAIQDILPHRYPFLLVDRITDLEVGKRIVGLKNVTINEPFFQGHFPGRPVMPGVLIIEAMAQVGGVLMLNSIENPKEHLAMFTSIDKAKFRRQVIPGDQLVFDLELLSTRRNIIQMRGRTFVDGTLVAEAEMMAAIIPRSTGD